MSTKLETRGLTAVEDGERIVDDVSLAVAETEVLAIVGPSGAGFAPQRPALGMRPNEVVHLVQYSLRS